MIYLNGEKIIVNPRKVATLGRVLTSESSEDLYIFVDGELKYRARMQKDKFSSKSEILEVVDAEGHTTLNEKNLENDIKRSAKIEVMTDNVYNQSAGMRTSVIVNLILGIFRGFIKGMTDEVADIARSFSNIENMVKSIRKAIVSAGKLIFSIPKKIAKVLTEGININVPDFGIIAEKAKNLFELLKGAASSAVSGIDAEQIGFIIGYIPGMLMVDSFKNTLTLGVGALTKLMPENGVFGKIIKVFGTLKKAEDAVYDRIKGAFKDLIGSIANLIPSKAKKGKKIDKGDFGDKLDELSDEAVKRTSNLDEVFSLTKNLDEAKAAIAKVDIPNLSSTDLNKLLNNAENIADLSDDSIALLKSDIIKEAGFTNLNWKGVGEEVKAFTNMNVNVVELDEPLVLYRRGNLNEPDGTYGLGKWWGDKYRTIDEVRDELAVLEEWGNPLTGDYKIVVPKGTKVLTGTAAPQKHLDELGNLVETRAGGGVQFWLDDIPKEWLTN